MHDREARDTRSGNVRDGAFERSSESVRRALGIRLRDVEMRHRAQRSVVDDAEPYAGASTGGGDVSNRLLYRNKREFAVGHGCVGDGGYERGRY